MKVRNVLALTVIVTATAASLAAVALSAAQLRPERAATTVLVETATVAQLNALHSTIAQLGSGTQEAILHRNGIASVTALEEMIAAEETELEIDQLARHAELEHRNRALIILMALAAFTSAASAMGAILLTQAFRSATFRTDLQSTTNVHATESERAPKKAAVSHLNGRCFIDNKSS